MLNLIILLLSLVFSANAFAEDVASYSGDTYLGCRSIGDTNVWLNNPNDYRTVKDGYLYVPSGCNSLPSGEKKMVDGVVTAKTQAELDAESAAIALAQKNGMYEALKAELDNPTPSGILLETVMEEVIDELKAIKGNARNHHEQ